MVAQTSLPFPRSEQEDWDLHSISAPDLFTLSYEKHFSALNLWKVFEGVKRLADLGVTIHNFNGILNLIAWIDSNDGHLISHGQVPKGMRRSPGNLFLATNFVRDLRHQVAIDNDVHGIRTVDGNTVIVRRLNDSAFPEENGLPIYVAEEQFSEAGLPFVYVSNNRAWWCHALRSTSRKNTDYDRWLMLQTWLAKIIPAIEPYLNDKLDKEVVLLRVEFEACGRFEGSAPTVTREEIESSFSLNVEKDKSTVTVSVGEMFEYGLMDPTNIAEREIVMAICRGFARLAETEFTNDQLADLENKIIESDDARRLHAFRAATIGSMYTMISQVGCAG